MKYFKIIAILCMIVLTFSCEKGSNNENGTNSLKDSKWNLLGFLPHDTQIVELKPGNLSEMNIAFNDNNFFHALSSCNTFDGDYSVSDPDSIMIENIYMTLLGCPDDMAKDWEEKYFYELINAENFQIAGDSLIIETKLNTDIIFLADYITN
jgi:heat shock protein HslJ